MSEQQMNDATFGRLFIIMIIAMTVLAILLMILATLASSEVNAKLDDVSISENSSTIAQRLAPIGEFNAETVAAAPLVDVVMTGEQAYASCAACHAQGIVGAPLFGDASVWEARIAQGMDILYEHAINGYTGEDGIMPPKGGNLALSDENVRIAVDYMVEQAQ